MGSTSRKGAEPLQVGRQTNVECPNSLAAVYWNSNGDPDKTKQKGVGLGEIL